MTRDLITQFFSHGARILLTIAIAIGLVRCLALDDPKRTVDYSRPSPRVQYAVSAVIFGETKAFPKYKHVSGASKKKKVPLLWMYWLVEGKQRKIIIDPGFYKEESVKRYAKDSFTRPDEVLREIDLSCDDVTDVLITHYHYSAMEAVTLYPKATVYLQSGAYARAKRLVAYGQAKKALIDTDAVRYLERKSDEGKLRLIDGNFEFIKGIKAYQVNLHTQYYAFYAVHTRLGAAVIAGDLVPYYENVEKDRPIAQVNGKRALIDVYEQMRRIVSITDYILPHYDKGVKERLRRRSKHVYRI